MFYIINGAWDWPIAGYVEVISSKSRIKIYRRALERMTDEQKKIVELCGNHNKSYIFLSEEQARLLYSAYML